MQQKRDCWHRGRLCVCTREEIWKLSLSVSRPSTPDLPLVTASSAQPHPVAPPPMTRTSNSDVFLKVSIWASREGGSLFTGSESYSAALTYARLIWCKRRPFSVVGLECSLNTFYNMLEEIGKEIRNTRATPQSTAHMELHDQLSWEEKKSLKSRCVFSPWITATEPWNTWFQIPPLNCLIWFHIQTSLITPHIVQQFPNTLSKTI